LYLGARMVSSRAARSRPGSRRRWCSTATPTNMFTHRSRCGPTSESASGSWMRARSSRRPFTVVGVQFDTVFKEGAYLLRPDHPEHGAAQTLDLAPAQGGFVEFALPVAGRYSFIDHAMVDAERGAEGMF